MNYEIKIKRTIIDSKGNNKTINETLFNENQVAFGDAEAMALDYYNRECDVVGISISKVVEVINKPAEETKEDLCVYKAVVTSIFVDDNGEEKELKYPILLWAKSVEHAMTIVKEWMKQGIQDMTCTGIVKTKIKDIIL